MKLKIQTLLIITFIVSSHSLFSANEIHKAILHEYNDTTYLILHLFNFHATGGSYEQGNLRTSGYNESEIRIINLSTKKTINSKQFGEYNYEGAFEVLGCYKDQIWIYSMQNQSGLQSIKLQTLEKSITQATIYSNMSQWTGRFITPEWNKISEYFSYNNQSDQLYITTYKKNNYLIRTKDFSITETSAIKTKDVGYSESLWKVIYTGFDTLDLYDEYIHKNNLKQLPNNQFIEGSFILETNSKKQHSHFQYWLNEYTNHVNQINNKLTRNRVKEGSENYNTLNNRKKWLLTKIDETNSNILAIKEGRTPDRVLLKTEDGAFFVLQRDSDNKTSSIAISKVQHRNNELSVEWKTPINRMYYNVAAVQESPLFKRYFNNTIPDPSFIKIKQFDNNLLIVYLMQVCIIDIETGSILWKTKL